MASIPPLIGEVVAFDEHSGLGAVRTGDGREWPFHCTRIADGSRTVSVGSSVVFAIGPGAPGCWEACALVKVP